MASGGSLSQSLTARGENVLVRPSVLQLKRWYYVQAVLVSPAVSLLRFQVRVLRNLGTTQSYQNV